VTRRNAGENGIRFPYIQKRAFRKRRRGLAQKVSALKKLRKERGRLREVASGRERQDPTVAEDEEPERKRTGVKLAGRRLWLLHFERAYLQIRNLGPIKRPKYNKNRKSFRRRLDKRGILRKKKKVNMDIRRQEGGESKVVWSQDRRSKRKEATEREEA